MTAFEAYKIYCSIKCHFKIKDYDYFMYHGKLKNIDIESFEKRRDRYYFESLVAVSNHLINNKEDLETKLFLYSLLNHDIYIKDFISWCRNLPDYYWKYDLFQKDPKTVVLEDLRSINHKSKFIKDPLFIFSYYMKRKILLESFLFINKHLKILRALYDKDNPVLKREIFRIKKYIPYSFMNKIDKNLAGQIHKSVISLLEEKGLTPYERSGNA